MPLPSKFLMAGATMNWCFPAASSLQTHSLTSLQSSLTPPPPHHHHHHHLQMSFSRLYSTPAASPLDSGPNLLDKAADLNSAFTLPPLPPPPPSAADAATSSLAELGLGGYWPPGLTQQALDFLHSLGLPWWSCIVIGACVVRPFMIPLFAAVQRNSINMMNNAPELQQFQMKMLAAHQIGDRTGVLRIAKEQRQFMKDNDISHLRQLRLIAIQGIVFVSMFVGLRGMAELPIESFKTEGLLHIVDLTTRDPYFIMPSVVSLTMFLILRLGAEGISMKDFPPWLRLGMTYGIPVVTFLPVAYFPSAMGIYWVTSNFFSLGQFLLFRSEFGKKIFRIPEKRQMPQGWGMALDKFSFAEQMDKMNRLAAEAAQTQAKLKSFELPDDRGRYEGLKNEDTKGTLSTPMLTPEEVATRHSDIKKMIKEINEMKKKVQDLQPEVKKMEDKAKPPDIHITIPKDKIE